MNRYNINYIPGTAGNKKNHLHPPQKSFESFLNEANQPLVQPPINMNKRPYRQVHTNVGLLCSIKTKVS